MELTEALAVSLAGHESIGVDVRPGSGDQDRDCDYWTDDKEVVIGTDSWDACPDSPSDDAWPPDFNNNTAVNIWDVQQYAGRMGCYADDPPCYRRLDLNADGVVNISDMMIDMGYLGKQCSQ